MRTLRMSLAQTAFLVTAAALTFGTGLSGLAQAAVPPTPPSAAQPTRAATPQDDTLPGAVAALPPTSPYAYFIKNSGLTTTVQFDTDALRIKLWNMPSNINPIYVHVLWHFNPVPGVPGYYFIENHNQGCLDILDGISKGIGVALALRQCDGTQSQMWSTPYKDGRWAMKNKWSGLWAAARSPIVENRVLTQQFDGSFQELYFDMPYYGSF